MYYAIKVRNVLGYFARQSIEMFLVGHIKFNDWCRLGKPASNACGQTKRATKASQENGCSLFLCNLGDMEGDRTISKYTSYENILSLQDSHC